MATRTATAKPTTSTTSMPLTSGLIRAIRDVTCAFSSGTGGEADATSWAISVQSSRYGDDDDLPASVCGAGFRCRFRGAERRTDTYSRLAMRLRRFQRDPAGKRLKDS